MEKLAHLWNVSQFMGNLKSEQARNLQAFYTECCKNLENEVELPKQRFSSLTMCPYCGVPWKSMDCKVRISKSRRASKSVRQLLKHSDDTMPRVRSTLVAKCKRNEMNKLVMKCSTCTKSTEIPMLKPQKEQKVKSNASLDSVRKKKKKKKDKTAGLNIPEALTPKANAETKQEALTAKNISNTHKASIQTPKLDKLKQEASMAKKNSSAHKSSVQTLKPKKLNVNRLKNIMNKKTPQKRKSLHDFLTELY